MLAAPHPHRHNFYSSIDLPSPAPSNDSLLDPDHAPSATAHSSRIPRSLYDSASTPNSAQESEDQLMTDAYSFQNPAIRVQQFPTAQQYQNPSWWKSLPDSASSQSFSGSMPASIQSPAVRRTQGHQRGPSSSSIGSNTPASPFSSSHATKNFSGYHHTATSALPISTSESFYSSDESRVYSNHHLPTPSQTPTQDSFLVSSHPNMYNNHSTLGSTLASHDALNRVMETQSIGDDTEMPAFSHSTRHSVSSLGHNSPITPHTLPEDEFDDGLKAPSNDMASQFYPDAPLYPGRGSIPKVNTSLLSPSYRIVSERLQAANNARAKSPNSPSRDASPFQQSSLYVHQSKPEASVFQQQVPDTVEQKTISPKDAVLDYHESEEDAKMPLFSDAASNEFQFMGGDAAQAAAQDFSLATSSAAAWSQPNVTSSQFATSAPYSSGFNYAPTSVPTLNMGYRRGGSYMPSSTAEETPEFPTHLTSMESSVSDLPDRSETGALSTSHTPVSQPGQSVHSGTPLRLSPPIHRPTSTLADAGTYSCTYHGCPQRFSTPQKLQKHKRDAHRQHPTGVTPGIGSGMSPADLMARNSQSGPHKCERINPTTGKPCNVVFSRPYDLTRHEDTIHNVRKQKVRCALCVEEKTFSRADALTRHMRVVHPEVDFPGKHRRRGGARS